MGRIPEETIEAIHNRIDIVDLVGLSMGPYTYESVMGGDVTVPLISADANGMRLAP